MRSLWNECNIYVLLDLVFFRYITACGESSQTRSQSKVIKYVCGFNVTGIAQDHPSSNWPTVGVVTNYTAILTVVWIRDKIRDI